MNDITRTSKDVSRRLKEIYDALWINCEPMQQWHAERMWAIITELNSSPEPEPALDDHSELMKKLPNVRPELLAEITKQSRWALERRVLIQADWLGSYSKCLDGFGLRYGVDGCWNPRDIREAVEKLRAAPPPGDLRADLKSYLRAIGASPDGLTKQAITAFLMWRDDRATATKGGEQS
jgi:hypothetical protein